MGFEYIVCDSPAGIETGALMAMHFADEALIVTNPEVSSVRDSDRILGMLVSKTKRAIEGKEPVKEHLLITRYNPKRVERGRDAVARRHPGDPAHRADRRDSGIGSRAACVEPGPARGPPKGTDVAEAYKDVVSRFLGEEKPLRFTDYQKPGLLQRIFGTK